jgi:Flp pilus assembly protein TadD
LPVGWLWFVGTLVPVIGIVQVGSQAYADRYTYIPYIGLFIMIAWGLPQLVSKWTSAHSAGSGQASSVESPHLKVVLGASMVIVLASLGICACRQVKYWNNGITLFSRNIEITGNNFMAYNNLGAAFGRLDRYAEAIDAYKQAIKIKPDSARTYHNLGAIYSNLGRYAEAIDAYKQAVKIKPDFAEARLCLGLTYLLSGDKNSALKEYEILKTLNAKMAEKIFNLIKN